MTVEAKEKNTKSSPLAIKLLIVVVLAFVASVTFRRSAGIIAMTPISLVMCIVAAFIGVAIWQKLTIFGITVFSVNTIENDDIKITLMFTTLCLLAILLFSLVAKLVKNRKKVGYAIGVIALIICIGLNIYFIGNPFKAIKANNAITDYTSVEYPENEDAYLGNFEFSKIYYRYDTKAYVVDAVSDKFPTETASITLGNEVIRDGFKKVMEDKLSESYVLEIKDVLRKHFPNDSFSVTCDGFASLPDEVIISSSDGALKNNLFYEIKLGGVQTGEQMKERIADYVAVLDESGVGYAKLTFKSGIGNWIVRSAVVTKSHIQTDLDFEVRFVSKATSNDFNRYLEKIIFK